MEKEQIPLVVDSPEEGKAPEVAVSGRIGDEDLPEGTVHCFPANPKQILIRRIITAVIVLLCLVVVGYLIATRLINALSIFLTGAIVAVCLLVFIQTFLIAGFRVAVDYGQNEVVLRYMFRKLKIPFEEFDCREGEPDQAQKAIGRLRAGGTQPQRMYLILDNVHDDACYQTSSYDLASVSDFLKLKEEGERISRVFMAREKFEAEQKALEREDAEEEEDAEASVEEIGQTVDPLSGTETNETP